MISATELRAGTVFEDGDVLYQVIHYEHIKMGRGSGTIKVKVRNLRTGSTTEKSFITGARVDEVNLQKRTMQYLYRSGKDYYFMDPESFEQITISDLIVGYEGKFLKEGALVSVMFYDDEALFLDLPRSLEFIVTEADPGVKGDSVSNIFKNATMDNGLTVKVPLFVKAGDKIKVDTRSGEYLERVK